MDIKNYFVAAAAAVELAFDAGVVAFAVAAGVGFGAVVAELAVVAAAAAPVP
uniref:Transcriptional corepressor LEUNIG-like n=1 Tax=Rhizophora mucronata TaxID=61149 RepID=A0A2P2MDY2_RHIMU